MNDFAQALKTQIANTNLVETENGAAGYERHVSDLVTFFFAVGSMRARYEEQIVPEFQKAYAEDPELAMRMLFYVRDIRGGLGERRTFRIILKSLSDEVFDKVAKLVPEYGRWDDLIQFLGGKDHKFQTVFALLKSQLENDLSNMTENKSISLLAKWMPSASKVNKDKVRLAKNFYAAAGWNEKQYRQTLSKLRAYLKVVECDMCSGNWGEINYSAVPSKANLNYSKAFLKHDMERRSGFLESVKNGETKMNVSALFPYEIVHAYHNSYVVREDLELVWKTFSESIGTEIGNAIVVRDGSGSMLSSVDGKNGISALDVATSLSILMSEHLSFPFKNKFITFSSRPQFVDLSHCRTLLEKVSFCSTFDECSNTNIERTMDLILETAKANSIPQNEIPAVIIVSDLEFDRQVDGIDYYYDGEKVSQAQKTLFAHIEDKWKAAGYSFPKIVFWNVNSRTNAVPMQKNDAGVALVSGFSPSVFGMIVKDGSPLDILRDALMVKRYDAVSNALGKAD